MGSLHCRRRQRQTRTSQQVEKGQETPTTENRTSKKDKVEVQRYQDIMSEKFSNANLQNMDPEEIIHHLSKLSYGQSKRHDQTKSTDEASDHYTKTAGILRQ